MVFRDILLGVGVGVVVVVLNVLIMDVFLKQLFGYIVIYHVYIINKTFFLPKMILIIEYWSCLY